MEYIFNIFLALILIVFFVVSLGFGGMTISTDKIGPQGFPQMVILISAVFLIAITVRMIMNMEKTEKINFNDKGFRIMLLNIAIFAAYIFGMNYISFVISTLIFSMVAIFAMGYRSGGKAFIFTLILTVGITLIFGRLFFVSLPRGIGIFRELSYFLY